MSERKLLLSLADSALYLGMSKSWLYGQVERGLIPHLRLGRVIKMELEQLNLYLEQCRKDAKTN